VVVLAFWMPIIFSAAGAALMAAVMLLPGSEKKADA
jgi:hypothetical protein